MRAARKESPNPPRRKANPPAKVEKTRPSSPRESGPKKKNETVKALPSDPPSAGIRAPRRRSFEEFLLKDARVPAGRGTYQPYSFAGREALLAVVRVIDRILGQGRAGLGSGTNPPAPARRAQSAGLTDAEVSLAGGAQFGKTLLELNLAAYLTGQQFRNFGLYLPGDDLVEGIVDSKFRPDVVDQIEWFADMARVGQALNRSGRAVNRKGAFLVTDGRRKAVGMIRGLGKVPTTFSMDAVALDEVDDIAPRMMKFVRGRLAASDLRLVIKIGTQRIHGRGMNQAWKEGSQGVFLFKCPSCGKTQNVEEEFPQIVRWRRGASGDRSGGSGERRRSHARSAALTRDAATPKLTWAGDFKCDGDDTTSFAHDPLNHYYLGCVACGAELPRTQPLVEHRQPALIAQRKWSFRISQLAIAAIDLSQIVGRFQSAVNDPDEMVVFRCDVLGLPRSTTQALTPAVLERARAIETYELPAQTREGHVAYGGLDMGDCCWLFVREAGAGLGALPRRFGTPAQGRDAGAPTSHRLLAAQKMAAADVVRQAQALFHQLGLAALFIDERPLVNEARSLALALNGLQLLDVWPRIANQHEACIQLPGGLAWDGRNARWLNLKCAVVRFSKSRLGAGIEQTLVFFEEGGQTKFVPCVTCNRFETIDRVVREFLTPTEGMVEVLPDGKVRETPAMRLPRLTPGHSPILTTMEAHLLTGSEREKDAAGALGDYVGGCANHLLLADAYSALAALVCGGAPPGAVPAILFEDTRRNQAISRMRDRSLPG